MELVFVKVAIKGCNQPQKTLREDIFKYYFEELHYTRKDFTSKLGLNHRIFTRGMKTYYTPEKIEELRIKKIVKHNTGGRVKLWDEKLNDIEVFVPGFKKLFEDNVKENPGVLMDRLIEINDKFYRFKLAVRPIKKYINQAISRKGEERKKFVANGLEAKVKFWLDDLGIKYECQFSLGKFFYDFRIGKTLLEVDGNLHTEKGDFIKTNYAKVKGYSLYRINKEEIRKEPIRIKKWLKELLLSQ